MAGKGFRTRQEAGTDVVQNPPSQLQNSAPQIDWSSLINSSQQQQIKPM
jgi:hypothetical protein